MKVLLLNTNDTGGAGRSVVRLQQGLLELGVNANIRLQIKKFANKNICYPKNNIYKLYCLLKPRLEQLPNYFYRKRIDALFHTQWVPDPFLNINADLDTDIFHLNWICGGFIQIESLAKIKKPVIWTLHDMWPFTGGCHHAGYCLRYVESCGKCPKLQSNCDKDISHWTWKRKQKAWKKIKITLVTPSQWLAKFARKSSLFKNNKIKVIPNGLNLSKFKPLPCNVKNELKEIFGLPRDKIIILFGAKKGVQDPNKGFELLKEGLNNNYNDFKLNNVELAIMGSFEKNKVEKNIIPYNFLGEYYDEEAISILYNLADVFVAPSLQENFPNTVMESLACGTPCVAFDIGGIPEMINHKENGYLAKPYDTEDLIKGIVWVIKNNRNEEISIEARKTAIENFNIHKTAEMYYKIYEKNIK